MCCSCCFSAAMFAGLMIDWPGGGGSPVEGRLLPEDEIDDAWEAFEGDIEQDSSAVPYAGKLDGLHVGNIITVQGLVHPECERFAINLCCHKDRDEPEPDLALHFNPRLSLRYVVRTTRFNGKWSPEETASCFAFPFKRGEAFTIDIFVAEEEFYCQVNHSHFCKFAFRTPVELVTELQVRGTGVSVGLVQRGEARSYPARPPPLPAPPVVPEAGADHDQIVWGNPAVGVLPDGLARGKELVIRGRIKLLPHSFYVNLQSSIHMWPHPDIPLHVNPRFMVGKKHVIIRNAWQQGAWGEEERTETSHMSPGTDFELRIVCEDDHYSVWAKDNLIGIFKFRMSTDCVRAVLVQGDLHVREICHRDSTNRNAILCDDF